MTLAAATHQLWTVAYGVYCATCGRRVRRRRRAWRRCKCGGRAAIARLLARRCAP